MSSSKSVLGESKGWEEREKSAEILRQSTTQRVDPQRPGNKAHSPSIYSMGKSI